MTKHEVPVGEPQRPRTPESTLRALRAAPDEKADRTSICLPQGVQWEAGRISRARELLRQQPPGPMPWEDPSLSRLEKVVEFFEYLPVTKGMLCGQRMRLLPFQVEFLRMIYGADPQPKIARPVAAQGQRQDGPDNGLGSLPPARPRSGRARRNCQRRHNAKAGGDDHAEVAAIIRAVPAFSARCRITEQRKQIEVLEGDGVGSTYASLAADHGPALGLAPTPLGLRRDGLQPGPSPFRCVENRERQAHAHARRRHFDASGNRRAPLFHLIDEKAPGTVRQIMAAPMDADPFDIETLRACNPACRRLLNESDLVGEASMAACSSGAEPSYRRFRLNQRVRTEADARICDAATWNRGAIPVDEAKLIGKTCICGFDDAIKHDLVALVMAFPSADGSFDILCRFWTPLGQLDGRRPAERELFRQWLRRELAHRRARPDH